MYSTTDTKDEIIAAVRANNFECGSGPVVSIKKNDWGIRGGHTFSECGHTAVLKGNCFTATVDGKPACPLCTIEGVRKGRYRIDIDSFANAMGRWVFEGSWPKAEYEMETDAELYAENTRLRLGRARAWANGQSLGPWEQGVPEDECRRIEAMRDEILADRATIPF